MLWQKWVRFIEQAFSNIVISGVRSSVPSFSVTQFRAVLINFTVIS